jgi:Apg6 BARA domain
VDDENDLEIEARAMSYNQFELTKSLEMFQLELEKLCLIDVSLYTLEVDETGRRYPKINGFRLAFCPKGDLEWDEIQIAWGQLAQLILSMSIVPRDWCIIPLTTCAKIIYQKEVFNLGKDISSLASALKVLVRMLESSGRLVPYTIAENMIGDIDIAKLSVNEESPSWSTLIHYLVSNLRHLSKCIAQERRDTMCELLIAV